jgi:hypothetical protein
MVSKKFNTRTRKEQKIFGEISQDPQIAMFIVSKAEENIQNEKQ